MRSSAAGSVTSATVTPTPIAATRSSARLRPSARWLGDGLNDGRNTTYLEAARSACEVSCRARRWVRRRVVAICPGECGSPVLREEVRPWITLPAASRSTGDGPFVRGPGRYVGCALSATRGRLRGQVQVGIRARCVRSAVSPCSFAQVGEEARHVAARRSGRPCTDSRRRGMRVGRSGGPVRRRTVQRATGPSMCSVHLGSVANARCR